MAAKRLPKNCQRCGMEIMLFRYGHTPDEHFCSAKCQLDSMDDERRARYKEMMEEAT